jgi:hypothetical protein
MGRGTWAFHLRMDRGVLVFNLRINERTGSVVCLPAELFKMCLQHLGMLTSSTDHLGSKRNAKTYEDGTEKVRDAASGQIRNKDRSRRSMLAASKARLQNVKLEISL